MTKSSKIITGLGVVAALGIAIVPASSFAADPYVTGQVEVDVEVLPAIAMTITGNNDNGASYGGAYDADTNPNGFRSVDNYDHDAGATEEETGTVQGHASAHISGVSSSYASLLPNSVVEGAFGTNANGFGSTITVYTNNSTGYKLSLIDSDKTTDLTNSNNDTIAAGTSIQAGTANWAYKIVSAAGTAVETPAYAAITAYGGTAATIAQTGTETTTSGSVSTVAYGVSTNNAQPTGVYTDTIVYTATVN